MTTSIRPVHTLSLRSSGSSTGAVRAGADSVEVWGNGAATRDFIHVRDAARAVTLAVGAPANAGPMNVGSGTETSISDLAKVISRLVGFTGSTSWLEHALVGPARRCVDITKAEQTLGFRSEIELRDGLSETIEWWDSQRATR